MAGEIIKANTLKEAEEQIISIYKYKSVEFIPATKEEYDKTEQSERTDSDNHINLERLGKDTKFVDLAYYKYLNDKWEIYRIDLADEEKKVQKQLYFKILPRSDI
ncbi:hypothetical protein JW911_02345 [Candidatus Peregrinibacteria bacterium]|nr:hypothetical protein [Candidatus Peregrinibacteria bacterium]